MSADINFDAREGTPRPPRTPQERWAHGGMQLLAVDCDGAVTDDGVGFNKSDTGLGKFLGSFFAGGGELTDTEWRAAIGMLRKYHGQIGECPARTAEDVLADEEAAVVQAKREAASTKHAAEKEAAKALERRFKKAIQITRETLPYGGDSWIVRAPYNAAARWQGIQGAFWSGARKAWCVPYAQSRALHDFLVKHYTGRDAVGPKGLFIIGEG